MRNALPASAGGAAKFIAGGLAVGLWMGAAAISGSAVAWAEDSSSGSSSSAAGSQQSSSGVDNGSAGSSGGKGSAGSAGGNGSAGSPGETGPSSSVSVSSGAEVRTGNGPAALLAANGSQGSRAGNGSAGSPGETGPSSSVSVSSGAEVFTGNGSQATPAGKSLATPLVANGSPSSLAASQNTALILGPSGMPIPSPEYIKAVNTLYVQPNSPPGTVPVGVFTPEGLYPVTGTKSLPLDTSVDQGLTILLSEINDVLDAGNTVTVFGWSQSAIIASLAMNELDPDAPVQFVLVGNEMNPNGGLLSRFPGLTIPSLGIDFYGPTPQNDFTLTNYTLEYDGFADFPRYPINFLSVLNAGLGIVFVHTKYASLTPQQIAPVSQGGQAIELESTLPNQRYFVIPTEDLPLLEVVRLVPLIGDPLADLAQPVLKVIINLGYGSDPTKGYSVGPANVGTPFGLFPQIDPGVVVNALVAAAGQGVTDFLASVSAGGTDKGSTPDRISRLLAAPTPPEFMELSTLMGFPPSTQSNGANAMTSLTGITDITNNLSNVISQVFSIVPPTADILTALLITLPVYDSTLFLDGLTQAVSGDPNGAVNAFGLPVAASVGLGTYSALIEVLAFRNVLNGIVQGPTTAMGN